MSVKGGWTTTAHGSVGQSAIQPLLERLGCVLIAFTAAQHVVERADAAAGKNARDEAIHTHTDDLTSAHHKVQAPTRRETLVELVSRKHAREEDDLRPKGIGRPAGAWPEHEIQDGTRRT